MRLILDADAIIKLNRGGVLRSVIDAFDCILPEAVYEEVVTTGLAQGHRDAKELEGLLLDGPAIVAGGLAPPRRGLGPGERAILQLLENEPEAFVVTDDRPFLALLTQTWRAFFTPPELVVNMVVMSVLSESEAVNSLERMRHAISAEAYLRALNAIGRTPEK